MIETQNTKTIMLIQPQVIADNAEWVGSKGSTPVTVDTSGYGYCDVYFALGATDVDMVELEIWEADASTYALVTGLEYGATGLAALPVATGDNKIYAFSFPTTKVKKNVQIFAKAGDGTSGSYACAWAVLSRPSIVPNTDAERGLEARVTI